MGIKISMRDIPKIGKKSTAALFRQAITWYADMLMGKRLADNIIVRIQFIEKLDKHEGIGGDCIWDDDNTRPREFTIRLDSSNDLTFMLRSLAHEMVHLKQFAKGELKDLWRGQSLCKYDGRVYDINDDKLNYWDYPWEIEAHGREEGLCVRFCAHIGLGEDEDIDKAL